jgi:NitT/TauT family transport system permease protein
VDATIGALPDDGRDGAKAERSTGLVAPALAFGGLLAATLWPGEGGRVPVHLLVFADGVGVAGLLRRRWAVDEAGRRAVADVTTILFAFLALWQLATARFGLLDPMLFPPPELVARLFVKELPDLVQCLGSSLVLLVGGFGTALVTALPLGLWVGWHERLHRAVGPFTKILGTIPPVVFIPYIVHVMPTFRSASVVVIFIGAFWPIFINTVAGVHDVPKGLIDSGRVLELSKRRMLLRVVLPAALPSICTGASLALCFSFLLLTAAEVIGGKSGLGWYVHYFSDFADYPRVVVGILFIGVVVVGMTLCTERLERHLLRWRS